MITTGVPRTSIIVSAIRSLISNAYIKNELDKNNGDPCKFKERGLKSYYDNVFLKDPIYPTCVHKNILTFDPYAFYFISTNEAKEVITKAYNTVLDQYPQLLESLLYKNHLSRVGFPPNIKPSELKKDLEACTTMEVWNKVTVDTFIFRMALRSKLIDGYIEEYITKGYQQFVILGAGLDTRSLRLDFRPECTVWEIDFQQVLQFKERVLHDALKDIGKTSQSTNIEIASDLMNVDEWATKLKQTGFSCEKPSVWLLEGLVMYLTDEQVKMLLSAISSVSASGSSMLIQTMGKEVVNKQLGSSFVSPLIKDELKSAIEDPAEYFNFCGFSKDIKSFKDKDIQNLFNCTDTTGYIESSIYYTLGCKP